MKISKKVKQQIHQLAQLCIEKGGNKIDIFFQINMQAKAVYVWARNDVDYIHDRRYYLDCIELGFGSEKHYHISKIDESIEFLKSL